jgi:hypothetical protein
MCRVVPAWPHGGMLFGGPLSLCAQLPVLDLFVCAGPSLLGLSCPVPCLVAPGHGHGHRASSTAQHAAERACHRRRPVPVWRGFWPGRPGSWRRHSRASPAGEARTRPQARHVVLVRTTRASG